MERCYAKRLAAVNGDAPFCSIYWTKIRYAGQSALYLRAPFDSARAAIN